MSASWLSEQSSLRVDGAAAARPLGPLGRCCAALNESYYFWRIVPWVFAFLLIGFGDFYTIAIALTVFYECPELVNAWISSVAISFVITWLVQDPMWILFRNNCFATKKHIRTAKYQFAEKVAAGPLRALAHAVASL